MSERTDIGEDSAQPSPYLEIGREAWARMSEATPQPFTEAEVQQIRGIGDKLSLTEVAEVYLPVSKMLNVHATANGELRKNLASILPVKQASKVPFVIGIAGSVAVGKSTVARLLRELLSRWQGTPRVQLITTDGFLHPNSVLESRGLLSRKGFPESYDRRALLKFMASIKGGAKSVKAPVYSHLVYDIVPDEFSVIDNPDVLIVEGLNVLQPAMGASGPSVSDYFDFGIYVDARTSDIESWYIDRFLKLRHTAFADQSSYFHKFAGITDTEARAYAHEVWKNINEPNLYENILRTRGRANLVLKKDSNHTVQRVMVRKL